MTKYDGPAFNDPIVRCTECQKIIFRTDLQTIGKCPSCGCRKVRSVSTLNDSELKLLRNKSVDPEYIALFSPVETEVDYA